MNKEKTKRVLDYFEELYPDAHCELNHRNVFELLVAVMLSAQTTDKKVNQVTPGLFEKYPKVSDFANASLEELQELVAETYGIKDIDTINNIILSKQLHVKKARTLEEIGKIFNLTRERVRQIQKKAILRMRHSTRRKKLVNYRTN